MPHQDLSPHLPDRPTILLQLPVLDTPDDDAFHRLTRLAGRLLSAPMALVSLLDEQGQFVKSAIGLPEPWASRRETPLCPAICQQLLTGEPLVVEDARLDGRLRGHLALSELAVVACLGFPLTTRAGLTLGSFCVMDTQPRQWTSSQVEALQELALSLLTEIELRAEIAERKRVTAELERTSQELRRNANDVQFQTRLLEHVGQAVIAMDLQRRITYWNHVAEQLYGWSRAEVLGADVASLKLVPDEGQETAAQIREQLTRGETWTGEFSIQCKQGQRISVLATNAPIYDAEGRVSGFIGLSTDITLRNEADAALREQKELLQTILDHIPVMIAVMDTSGQVVFANREWEEVLGWSPGEISQVDLAAELYPDPELRTRALEFIERADETWCEFRIRPRDGGVLDTCWANIRLSNGWCIGIGQDLTERKRAEESLDHLFVSSLDMLCVAGLDGYFKRLNPAWESTLGYSQAELRAQPFIELVHPEDRASTLRELGKLATGAPTLYFENRYRCRDGSYRWLAWNSYPDPEHGLIYAVARDMTQQKETEATLQRVQEQLTQAQKMEAVGRLAGGVAHDFNNMLAVINGYTGLLLTRVDLDGAMRSPLQEVLRAGERAASLIGQLLAFSRKSMVTYQELDPNEVISGMERVLRRLIGENIDLRTDLEPEVGSIKADRGQVEQIVTNLAVNARDAMPNGGQFLIQTRRRQVDGAADQERVGIAPGEYVELVVTDSGSGMDTETLQHLWEPFYSTKGHLGTGLGLSTVYGIIQQSGGSVAVESELGKGSTFRILLPRLAAPGAVAAATATEPIVPQGAGTILVVEDEEMVRRMARNVLQMSNYQVLEAASGEEALRIVQQHPERIDLLITDVVMPRGMSGRAVAERLVQLRPNLKVLYISGYADDEVLRDGIQREGAVFLPKPFSPNALTLKVRELLPPHSSQSGTRVP